MIRFQDIAERIQRGEPLALPLDVFLSLLTPLTRLGMLLRKCMPVQFVDAYVVSFGNLTTGGTGKTPAVIERAQHEVAAGNRVAVLTRGYGTRSRGIIISPPTGEGRSVPSVWLGDEPELIRKRVPQVAICKGSDRVESARRAIKELKCNFVILDDGFQYVRLHRNENIVMIDASNPFGNGRLLPRGILREPLEALSRATQIILTKCDLVPDLRDLLAVLDAMCPGVPVRRTRHAPCYLERVCDGKRFELEMLRSREVTAACAIGNPNAFFQTLERLMAKVGNRICYPDHARIDENVLPSEGLVITTEKDAIKMRHAPENVYALVIRLEDM